MPTRSSILLIVALLAPTCRAETKFDPKLDGAPFANAPNYVNAGGTCFGMAAVAIANWMVRAKGGHGLTGTPAEAQAVAVQVAYEDRLATDATFRAQDRAAHLAALDPSATARRLRELIASEGPQILILEKPGENHAVVAYASDANGFAIYDSDTPGETRRITYDQASGFGGPRYGPITRVTIAAQRDQFVALAKSLNGSCADLGAQCAAEFWRVDAHATRDGSGQVVVTGTLVNDRPREAWRPETVVAFENGQPVGRAAVPSSGPFTLTLPASVKGPLRIEAFVGMMGHNLAGFATHDIAVPPTPTVGVVNALANGVAR